VRLKTEWYSHLHSVRQREIDLIFARCPAQAFEHGLELGAGDGFQSTLLTKYVARLVSTDLNPNRLRRTDTETVAYMTCDAENVNAFFDRGQFDLVFSSSLLEHLPRLDQALHGIHTVLKDGGITIHVIPNQFWKLGHVALYHPNRLITKLERIIQPRPTDNQRDRDMDNNLKTPRRERRSRLWPAPHGAYNSNLEVSGFWQNQMALCF
jgi:ubiquinone/menaquinone biosynthesis C-methylase UbiE